MYVRQLLEEQFGPRWSTRAGFRSTQPSIPTCRIPPSGWRREQIDLLQDHNVTNASLVAFSRRRARSWPCWEVWTSNDNAIDGQVNVAYASTQPGSAIKPLTYLAAFEKEQGWWTTATLIEDVLTEFPDGANEPYVPVNYDGREHGWVSVRQHWPTPTTYQPSKPYSMWASQP